MATEDLDILKASYKNFLTSPAGTHLMKHLESQEKTLVFQAQRAQDALQAMGDIRKSAAYGEIKALIDSLTR